MLPLRFSRVTYVKVRSPSKSRGRLVLLVSPHFNGDEVFAAGKREVRSYCHFDRAEKSVFLIKGLMNYLFFDIECASVFKNTAKICAFGYCLTDEQFHILEKDEILINPQGGFHLTDRKGTQGLVLPYEYGEFKNYPSFPKVAPKIYGLLQDENTLVVGHATMNDVKYLNLESKRFSLPSFRFSFADTQFLYMNRIGVFNRQFGLGAIAEALGVEFTPHRAADDAYATMKIGEALCEREGLPLLPLIEKYEIRLGRIENYSVTQSTSKAERAYREEAAKKKEARDAARAEFHCFADRERHQA